MHSLSLPGIIFSDKKTALGWRAVFLISGRNRLAGVELDHA
jgi:hypothetical protein